jgi:hypothetical protein
MNPFTAECYIGLLNHLKATIKSDAFFKRHRRSEKDFTRQRCLTFLIVLCFLLNMIKRALQDELDEFFTLLSGGDLARRQVSKSAFTQARKKLKHTAFIEMNKAQVRYFYDHFAPQKWHGFRLLAFDGSMADLPHTDEVCAHFGVWHPQVGGECPKARLSQMFDVLNKVTIEAIIAPKDQGERALAAQHSQQLNKDDLVLLDRGYPAFWVFAAIGAKGANFCARMSLTEWKVVAQFVASGRAEQRVCLRPGYEARKACLALNLSTAAITVRLVRLDLDNGEVSVLATSLVDPQQVPPSLFQTLYPHRWPVETDYRQMKLRLEVENWTGTSVEAISQDFHATVFTKNLAAILAGPAQIVVTQPSPTKTYRYQINMANLFSKMKDTVVLLFVKVNPLPLLYKLWSQMTRTLEPIRPNRSFPRKKRVKPKRFAMNYKPLR